MLVQVTDLKIEPQGIQALVREDFVDNSAVYVIGKQSGENDLNFRKCGRAMTGKSGASSGDCQYAIVML